MPLPWSTSVRPEVKSLRLMKNIDKGTINPPGKVSGMQGKIFRWGLKVSAGDLAVGCKGTAVLRMLMQIFLRQIESILKFVSYMFRKISKTRI